MNSIHILTFALLCVAVNLARSAPTLLQLTKMANPTLDNTTQASVTSRLKTPLPKKFIPLPAMSLSVQKKIMTAEEAVDKPKLVEIRQLDESDGPEYLHKKKNKGELLSEQVTDVTKKLTKATTTVAEEESEEEEEIEAPTTTTKAAIKVKVAQATTTAAAEKDEEEDLTEAQTTKKATTKAAVKMQTTYAADEEEDLEETKKADEGDATHYVKKADEGDATHYVKAAVKATGGEDTSDSSSSQSNKPPITIVPANLEDSRCQSGWSFFQSFCYLLRSSQATTFDEADSDCKSLSGNLAVVFSDQVQQFLETKIPALVPKGPQFWIGYTSKNSSKPDQFKWVQAEGVKLTGYTSWEDGQTPKDEANRCVYMNGVEEDGVWSAKWQAGKCGEPLGYVCQKSLVVQPKKDQVNLGNAKRTGSGGGDTDNAQGGEELSGDGSSVKKEKAGILVAAKKGSSGDNDGTASGGEELSGDGSEKRVPQNVTVTPAVVKIVEEVMTTPTPQVEGKNMGYGSASYSGGQPAYADSAYSGGSSAGSYGAGGYSNGGPQAYGGSGGFGAGGVGGGPWAVAPIMNAGYLGWWSPYSQFWGGMNGFMGYRGALSF